MNPLLSYEQVRLYPNKFDGKSRSECNTTIKFGPHSFHLPVTPSNMVCTIDATKARELSESGYFYVMHRFGNTPMFVLQANQENWRTISISIGVKDVDYALIDLIKKSYRVDYITVDLAHGFCEEMRKMLAYLKQELPNAFRIAGNACDRSAALFLQSWGAQAVKIGIAQGGACTTHGKTGFGLPMFSCVRDICYNDSGYGFEQRTDLEVPLVADGGIRTNGDIAKAFVAGASMVMVGSMFAALKDSPAETIYLTNDYSCTEEECDIVKTTKFPVAKKYFGSASAQNGNTKNIEGTEITLPYDNRTYQEKLIEIKQDLQSAISYAGGLDLNAFKRVKYGFTY